VTNTSFPYELNAPSTSLALSNSQVTSTGATRTVEKTLNVSWQAGNDTAWGSAAQAAKMKLSP
jgi:hypothetical protein